MPSEATMTIIKMVETLPEQAQDRAVEHLREYIEDGTSIAPYLIKTAVNKLTLLPAGKPIASPSELLSSEKMYLLVQELDVFPHRAHGLDELLPFGLVLHLADLLGCGVSFRLEDLHLLQQTTAFLVAGLDGLHCGQRFAAQFQCPAHSKYWQSNQA